MARHEDRDPRRLHPRNLPRLWHRLRRIQAPAGVASDGACRLGRPCSEAETIRRTPGPNGLSGRQVRRFSLLRGPAQADRSTRRDHVAGLRRRPGRRAVDMLRGRERGRLMRKDHVAATQTRIGRRAQIMLRGCRGGPVYARGSCCRLRRGLGRRAGINTRASTRTPSTRTTWPVSSRLPTSPDPARGAPELSPSDQGDGARRRDPDRGDEVSYSRRSSTPSRAGLALSKPE